MDLPVCEEEEHKSGDDLDAEVSQTLSACISSEDALNGSSSEESNTFCVTPTPPKRARRQASRSCNPRQRHNPTDRESEALRRSTRGQSSERRSRGRPRGGRGRPRGGRSTRGCRAEQQVERSSDEQALKAREDKLKEIIDQMQESELREVLLKICAGDVQAASIVMATVQQPDFPEPADSRNVDWCVCGNCTVMPNEYENVCCGKNPNSCSSRAPGFDISILDRQVLRLAMLHRNDITGLGHLAANASVADVNKSYRHSAYRQYVLYHYGRLGYGVRRVIPSCCVCKIRSAYPDPNGQYHGWREAP